MSTKIYVVIGERDYGEVVKVVHAFTDKENARKHLQELQKYADFMWSSFPKYDKDNPEPHNRHLEAAQNAMEYFSMEEILLD